MIKFTQPAGTIRRLLKDVTVTIGEVVNIDSHPSGSKFNGPTVVVGAFTNPIFGLGLDHIPTGAFVKAVSLADPAHRVVTIQIAATIS